jgi:hypothetical protein
VSRFRDDFSLARLGRTESCKVCPAIFDADPRTFEFECESLRGLTVTVPFPRSRRPYAQTNVVRDLTAIICNPRESIDMHCRVIQVPLSACLILNAGCSSVAAGVSPAPEASASRHDNDNYNLLDLAEAKAMAGVHFDELNNDSDTALETEEVKAVVGESLFRAADTDHDGSLSKDEYLALVQKLFKKADIDHIGTLRASELRSKAGSALRKLIGCWVKSGERLSVSSKRPPATTSTTGHLRLRSSAMSYSLPWR